MDKCRDSFRVGWALECQTGKAINRSRRKSRADSGRNLGRGTLTGEYQLRTYSYTVVEAADAVVSAVSVISLQTSNRFLLLINGKVSSDPRTPAAAG